MLGIRILADWEFCRTIGLHWRLFLGYELSYQWANPGLLFHTRGF